MSKKHGAHGTGVAAPCGVYASVRTCANHQIGGQKADNSHSNEMLGADVGLLSKTENNLGVKSGCLRRLGMVWGLADGVAGTNLVQIEFAERTVALGCAGSLFASAFEFGRSAGNSALAAA